MGTESIGGGGFGSFFDRNIDGETAKYYTLDSQNGEPQEITCAEALQMVAQPPARPGLISRAMKRVFG